MNPEIVTVIIFVGALVLVFSGLGIGFALASSALIIGFLVWGIDAWATMFTSIQAIMMSFLLVAILCFIFMAMTLETSGIAGDLFNSMHAWFGPLAGGLAVGTVIICTLFAAMSGISATATMTMGLIAMPAMLKRNYSKDMAIGPIAAGGALGILIPPSVLMIIYGLIAEVSVGKLFMGGIFAGFLLSALFITYILVRSNLQPRMAPPLPPEERLPFIDKLRMTKGLILPILLIIGVLGSIFAGIATPTEAAAVGAAGAVLCTLILRRFSFKRLFKTGLEATRLTSAVLWLIIGAKAFAAIYSVIGSRTIILDLMTPFIEQPLVVLILFQIIFFILGCIMEPTAIIVIFSPIFLPVVEAAGLDPVWFGVLFIVNMQMGMLTPPFGYNLFYLRAVAPPSVTILDIYKSIIPFVILQAIGLILCIVFPQIILWLPQAMLGK